MMDGPSLVMIYAMPYSLRWNNPRYWHRRAEEVRTVGERMSNIEARTGMRRLAANYEVMAQRAQEWFDSSTNPLPEEGDHAHARSSADVVFRAFDRYRGFTGNRM
jgi:hypothetical protein